MALKATIYKATVSVSDTDRAWYGDLVLTLAQHPSETLERMMVRLLVYCCHAADGLSFTRGLSSIDEPDIWLKSDDGRILKWIEVGQPAPERLKKASGISASIPVYAFGRGVDIWWRTHRTALLALPKVSMTYLQAEEVQALAALAEKNMTLTVYIAESTAYVSDAQRTVTLQLDTAFPG